MTVVMAYEVVNAARSVNPRSHSVFVDRRSGDGFARIPGLPMVKPGEAVRYSASGLETGVTFQVFDSNDVKVFEKNTSMNLVGNGWVDTVAPMTPGFYLLRAKSRDVFLGGFPSPFTHNAELTFEVNKDAPEPPGPSPGRFNFPNFFGDIKPLVYIGVGVIGLIAVANIVTSLRK